MEQLIKNLDRAQPLPLKEQVAYEKGKVVSLTLTQRPGVGMTLFAFDAGEGGSPLLEGPGRVNRRAQAGAFAFSVRARRFKRNELCSRYLRAQPSPC